MNHHADGVQDRPGAARTSVHGHHPRDGPKSMECNDCQFAISKWPIHY